MKRDRISLFFAFAVAGALAMPASVADAAKAKSKAATAAKSSGKAAPKATLKDSPKDKANRKETSKTKGKTTPQPAASKALPPGVALPAVTGAAFAPAPASAARSLGHPPLPVAPTTSTSHMDLATAKRAFDLIRRNKADEATELKATIADPVAVKLVEWAILRSDSYTGMSFERYTAFINANPTWPSIPLLRRRTEGSLWDDNLAPAAVRAFFGNSKPTTAKGRLALARALLAQGDRNGAAHYVRETWRVDSFSRELETLAHAEFGPLLTAADVKARMDRRLYANDNDGALSAAHRLGGAQLAIAKARIAVNTKAGNAKALLDAVPADARSDAGYVFSRIQFLRRGEKWDEAAKLMLSAPQDPAAVHDPEEWWTERRLLARKLLDLKDAKTAYLIARDAAPPTKENPRAEQQFTAGWIALRFLNDPGNALAHFSRIAEAGDHPTTRARAAYWLGRAAEAAGRQPEARRYFEAAAQFSAAYYGQIARARLGITDIALNEGPDLSAQQRASLAKLEVVRAIEILYATDQRDLVVPAVIDLAERLDDVAALKALADVTARHDDARSMLFIGKTALARGLPLDGYAFPTIGIPQYNPIGPVVEPSVVYAIARQESGFNPRVVSSARAMGLMQVTPDAGRHIAKKFKVAYDEKRLLHDSVYNVQMGAAEIGEVLQGYRGSYILAFAAYNAGRGRVTDWIERFGDPRDPKVDPIDWVERIPFSETRYYVQRVLENLQVYRVRFGGGTRLLIEADLRRGSTKN
jgi:soluble lytic murein transglycosylase